MTTNCALYIQNCLGQIYTVLAPQVPVRMENVVEYDPNTNSTKPTLKKIGFFSPLKTSSRDSLQTDLKISSSRIAHIAASNLGLSLVMLFHALGHIAESIGHISKLQLNEAQDAILLAGHESLIASPLFLIHAIIDTTWELLIFSTRIITTLVFGVGSVASYLADSAASTLNIGTR